MKRAMKTRSSKMSSKDGKKQKVTSSSKNINIMEKDKIPPLVPSEDELPKDIKPKLCFDYCDVVARVDHTNDEEVESEDIKIKEEILDDGSSIEISEPKIHQEEIGIIVPTTKTKHHPKIITDEIVTAEEDDNDRIDAEKDAQSYDNSCSVLDEDETSSSLIVDIDGNSAKNLYLSKTDDKSTESTSIETFITAFEELVSNKEKTSHCSYMETYGFIMTFRYVFDLPKQKRDKDSERAVNILLARYTGLDNLEVLQVLLEALNVAGDFTEFKTFDLQPVDCILITFLQLKVCISFKDIAKVFKCEEKVAATCFYMTIRKIKKSLKSVIYWPSREETEMTIPKFFKPAYSNVRTIFTNLVVQTIAPSTTNSNSSETIPSTTKNLRYVIGFAPSGFVSFISNAYNAETHSEEKIFRMEKLRQRFERNQDALMVLHGFPIENLLGVNNFRVFRPPFIVKKVLPDNKTIVRENFALFKHVTETCSSLQKFQILSLNLIKFPSTFIDEILFSICVSINYNVMFRNT